MPASMTRAVPGLAQPKLLRRSEGRIWIESNRHGRCADDALLPTLRVGSPTWRRRQGLDRAAVAHEGVVAVEIGLAVGL